MIIETYHLSPVSFHFLAAKIFPLHNFYIRFVRNLNLSLSAYSHLMSNRNDLANEFVDVFERLLAREKLDFYEEGMSGIFEFIARNLLGHLPQRKSDYFDGAVGLTAKLRKSRQVVFEGAMWVGDGKTQWTEDFQAIVTDKRITKQGIWFKVRVGSDEGEGDLSTAFSLE